MQPANEIAQDIDVNIVCSTKFGRYPKISVEQAFNLIQSDEFMVDYSGYRNIFSQNPLSPFPDPISNVGFGRGIYHSTKLNEMFVVIYNQVNIINPDNSRTKIGQLNTFSGDVFIAEDFQGHIAFCDKTTIWIYTVSTGSFLQATIQGSAALDFTPGYISYHNGRFLSVNLANATWRISDPALGNSVFPNTAAFVGGFQTKADIPIVILPVPGGGNNIIVMGSNSGQLWTSNPTSALFPYQLQTGVNFDYGTVNADSVGIETNIIAWVASNEKSSPFIMYSTGGTPKRISTDGIDFQLARLTAPNDCHGFLFRQDGHLIYQFCFPTDNVSYVYDFNTEKFFTVTDEHMDYHIAKKAVSFNNDYYFVSLNDGNVYQMDTTLTTYNYGYNAQSQLVDQEIPRVVVSNPIRAEDTFNFIADSLTVPFEMGAQPDVGMSVASVTVINGGSGYTSATVRFIGGGGSGAAAVINIGGFALLDGTNFLLLDGSQFLLLDSGNDIEAIFVTNGGNGYTSAPEVIIDGDGTGATAIANMSINTLARADVAISINGGEYFSNFAPMYFNTAGNYRNRWVYYGLGMANEMIVQLRLWSRGRFVMGNGKLSTRQ